MNFTVIDNVINDPNQYVSDIYSSDFFSVDVNGITFHGIQPRDADDELAMFILSQLDGYDVAYNFIRRSPVNQDEPNFIHTDEMMGDLTAILYLNDEAPDSDGTTIYDKDDDKICTFFSKFNRLVIFDSYLKHSRNIYENFGDGESARLIQVVFLKEKI